MRNIINRILVWLRLKKPAQPPVQTQGGGGPGEEHGTQ